MAVDGYTAYTLKSTSAHVIIDKLKLQQTIFGNLTRMISDSVTALLAKDFDEYCAEKRFEITT